MRRFKLLACVLMVGVAASIAVYAQGRGAAGAVVYEGARLIIGDASAPIDNGAFLVQNGQITAIGKKGAITVPGGATHTDLTGKTVMPALVNIHAHLGWELYTVYGDVPAAPDNFTAENLLDHLQREAFYGVGTVNDAGSAVIPIALQVRADIGSKKLNNAAALELMAGVVAPDGGPDGILIKGTRARHSSYEVLRSPEARKAVQDIADKKIHQLKIWDSDRNGSYPALSPQMIDAVIDEAHKHGILVHSHATNWAEQKHSLKAGVDRSSTQSRTSRWTTKWLRSSRRRSHIGRQSWGLATTVAYATTSRSSIRAYRPRSSPMFGPAMSVRPQPPAVVVVRVVRGHDSGSGRRVTQDQFHGNDLEWRPPRSRDRFRRVPALCARLVGSLRDGALRQARGNPGRGHHRLDVQAGGTPRSEGCRHAGDRQESRFPRTERESAR